MNYYFYFAKVVKCVIIRVGDNMLGLYIHIPFCKKTCPYCDFFKNVSGDAKKNIFVNALLEEMKIKKLSKYSFDTLYIGGGSPSCLPLFLLEKIFKQLDSYINLKQLREFTVELNPDDISEALVLLLKNYHVNRVSIGVQTFSPKLQHVIKRYITFDELATKLSLLRSHQLNNINLDLMYAIPGETMEDLDLDLNLLLKLQPTHVSAYSLILEEHTIFYHLYQKNKLTLVKDNEESKMYHHLCHILTNNHFFHYEISNFAIKGCESMHNLLYWNCDEYLALGPSASSYFNSYRFKNTSNMRKYLDGIASTKLVLDENEFISHDEKMKEELILGLRKSSGISVQKFKNKFSLDPIVVFPNIKKLLNEGLLKQKEDNIYIPQKHFYLTNHILVKIF